MKKHLMILAVAALSVCACKKSSTNNTTTTTVTENEVLSDFVNKIALPEYASLQVKAAALNAAVINLNSNPTDANLAAAQQAWRDVRTSWETCEGFLFGPIEDNNYDPNTDTWPVDYKSLDSLVHQNTVVLNLGTVQNFTQSLRGYHPLEFILWGQKGNATADSITANEKTYMMSLAQDILNNVDSLNASWATGGGNFQAQVLQAGTGSTRFTTKQDVFLAIAGSISDICNEVGQQNTDGKIYGPYSVLPVPDSFQTESPFSHNSMIDFKNNITGAQNAYLCTFGGVSGASLSNFVAMHNLSLDNTIKAQFTAAINALGNVNVTFESAIFTQRTQLQAAMTALNTLQATLDGDLKTYIQTYVKD